MNFIHIVPTYTEQILKFTINCCENKNIITTV